MHAFPPRARLPLPSSLVLAVALIAPACGETAPTSSTSSAATSAAARSTASASSSTSAAAARPPVGSVPAELRAKLDAGASCKWNEEGLMQACAADEPLKSYVESNRSPATLEGCLSAVSDEAPAIRVMAAACLYDYYFGISDLDAKPTAGKVFDVVLPAIERETSPGVRAALGTAIWQRDAASVGKTDAVISTLQKLDPAKDGRAMSFLVASLYHFGMTEEPPKGVLDLAAGYAASPSASLRQDAYALMGYAPARAEAFCPLLRRAVEQDADKWTDALSALNGLGQACEREAEAVHAAILGRLERAADPAHQSADEISSWGELRSYVSSDLRTPAQRDAVAKAADKIAKGAKTSASHKKYATSLADDARGKKAK